MSSSSPSDASATSSPRAAFYKSLLRSARQQLRVAPSRDPVSLMANLAALIYHEFRRAFGQQEAVNWAGFYLMRQVAAASEPASEHAAVHSEVLLLGPFHGQPAVSVIAVGRGVCGTAVAERATQVVPDVHSHPNHIACDSASQSEVVVPIFADEGRTRLVGVLDIDSPTLGFFSDQDRAALEEIALALGKQVDWTIFDAPIAVEVPEDASCPMNRPH